MSSPYERTAERLGVPKALVRYAVSHFAKQARISMNECTNKGIMIAGFISFMPRIYRIEATIKKYIGIIKSGNYEKTEDAYRKKISILWKFRRSLKDDPNYTLR